MSSLNKKLTQYCINNQARLKGCNDVKSLKRKLDCALNAITVDQNNLGLTDLEIVNVVLEDSLQSVNTEKVAKDFFAYLDLYCD